MSHSTANTPPPPPEVASRLRVSAAQWVGLPLMALVPVLAMAGVFGERDARTLVREGPLVVSVQSPTRFRYRQRMTLQVSVANGGTSRMRDVRVRIDSSYLVGFSNVVFSPSLLSDGFVGLGTLDPGAGGRLLVSMEGDRVGVLHGVVSVTGNSDTVRLAIATVIFP